MIFFCIWNCHSCLSAVFTTVFVPVFLLLILATSVWFCRQEGSVMRVKCEHFCVQCAVCSVQCVVCSVKSSVCSVQCAARCVQYVVCSVQCTVCIVWCAVCSEQCALCSVHYAVLNVPFIVRTLLFALGSFKYLGVIWSVPTDSAGWRSFYNMWRVVYISVHWLVSRLQCTVYSLQFTVYTVHCTVYSVQCSLYTVHCRV